MKNIWGYPQENDWIRIHMKNGDAFEGAPVVVNDADESDTGEIIITIKDKDGRYLGFCLSEIADIDEL